MGFKVVKASSKKAAARARKAPNPLKAISPQWAEDQRVARMTGVTHPFASDRAALRGFRRAQGGPGITEGSRPEPKPAPNDYRQWLIAPIDSTKEAA